MRKFFLAFLLAVMMLPTFAHGQEPPPSGGINIINVGDDIGRAPGAPTTGAAFGNIFVNLVNWFGWFVALAAVVMGLYSGFLFITGGGDDSKISKAKQIFIYTIIGIVVAIFAFSMVAIAQLVTGI